MLEMATDTFCLGTPEIVAEFADVSIRLVSLKDISPIQECIEDGATFEANAIKKAQHFAVLAPKWQ